MCSYSQQCVEENTVLRQGRIILWARGSLADDGSTVSKQLFCIRQCFSEDMYSYSQQCVEENTVLRQGRIILWARGSLADDGSTVKTSVPIFDSASMKIYVRILNSMWRKTQFRHKAE